jgi:ribosomal protein S18 acetylase RimI-like enzyme
MHAAAAAGAPAFVLEMYVANEAGRSTYRRLGFTESRRFRSGLLTP